MSVVAWDGKSIAADRQAVYNDVGFSTVKIKPILSGDIVALVGTDCHFDQLIDWYKTGADKNSYPDFQKTQDWSRFIVVNRRSCVFYEQSPYPIIVREKFFAWGCGKDLAIGAMAMGANAKQAVEITSFFNVYCGKGIDVFRIK